jgi:hypothetical protein
MTKGNLYYGFILIIKNTQLKKNIFLGQWMLKQVIFFNKNKQSKVF